MQNTSVHRSPGEKEIKEALPPGFGDGYWAIGLLLVVFSLRMSLLLFSPAGLSHDEAYYWDWSRQLDWGYYSKPPMIAWLIAGSTQLFGDTDFGVRFPAAVLSTVGLAAVYLLGRSMFDRRVGWWSMVLMALTPGSVALGFLMTIDAPLLAAWSVTMLALWQAIHSNRNSLRWWLLATLATAFGILSKQTMVAVFPACGLYLLTGQQTRRELLKPGFWLWAIASLLSLAPVVVWNSKHGWPTVGHTREHFVTEANSWLNRLTDSAEFWLSQFGVYSPVTFLMILASFVWVAFQIRHLSPAQRFLTTFSLLPLLGIIVLSLRQRLEPNWPGPFYVGALVLAAQLAVHRSFPWWGFRDRGLLLRAAGFGALFAGATFAAPFLAQQAPLRGSKLDPVVRLHGWQELAQEVQQVRSEADNVDAATPMLVTAGRAETSELAFYLPDHPRIGLWQNDDHVRSQYDLWGLPFSLAQQHRLLILSPSDEPLPEELRSQFSKVTRQKQIDVSIDGKSRSLRLDVYLAERDFQFAPDDSAVSPTLRIADEKSGESQQPPKR